MSSLPNRKYTVDEYFELERTSEIRHEYHNGEIYAMAGASKNHIRIAKNIMKRVDDQIEGGECESFISDMRVRVNDLRYVYPDVVVACGEADMGRNETLTNPTVVFEVLSDSTDGYDQNKKFEHYQKIPTLTDYLLIDQQRVHIKYHQREGDTWSQYRTVIYTNPTDTISIASIACTLTVADLYKWVVFDPLSCDKIE